MSKLVSVIIPVFNAIPYLEACLASVAAQTHRNIEVLIINDGSTDSSEELIHKYTSSNKNFKLFSQENHGLGYTRNRGISLSNGEYLFFLDADDTLPENAIELLVDAAENSGADIAAGKVLRFNGERKYVPIRHLEFDLYNEAVLTDAAETPELLQDSIACNKLWRKNFLVKHGLSFKEGKYYEDLAFTMKGTVLAEKIQLINKNVYNWRVRDEEGELSITQQQMTLQNTLDRLEALKENRQWLMDSPFEKRIADEHDLKSLLDVIRLHVLKFALVDEEEKAQWKRSITDFLSEIPVEAASKLPAKEKLLYSLLLDSNETDLLLLSKMLTDTEDSAIVSQEDQQFLLQGKESVYDVTEFLKAKLVIGSIGKKETEWTLKGTLAIPKASLPPNGIFYARERKEKREIIIEDTQLTPTSGNAVYPQQEQNFTARIAADFFTDGESDTVYDFYYRLDSYPQFQKARVRFGTGQRAHKFVAGNKSLTLYSTAYGNLSLKLESNKKQQIQRKLKSLIKKFIQTGK